MIELTRTKSSQTQILMSWIEPVDGGASARIHLVVEEAYNVKASYERLQALLRDAPDRVFKLT